MITPLIDCTISRHLNLEFAHQHLRAQRAVSVVVEAGIDGWHGIQPSIGMDLKVLKETYGYRLCFFGEVNCETLLACTPEETEIEVRYAIEHAAAGGGLVITCGNVLKTT